MLTELTSSKINTTGINMDVYIANYIVTTLGLVTGNQVNPF